MSKGRYGYLISNMAVFTVSNFVTKILVFLLVPLYTSVLTEAEYGVADVMQTTLLLTVPILSVNIGEAALRFGLSGEDQGGILRIGLKYVIRAVSIVFVAGGVAIALLKGNAFGMGSALSKQGSIPLDSCIAVFIVLFAADSIYEFMLLYCQGCERTKIMMAGSIACTCLVIASNLLLLLVFKLGLKGYLLSQIISFGLSALLMFVSLGGAGRLKASKEDIKALEKTMTGYGRNMQLYAASSWANNAVDRYFILFMLGSAANGLYGVAYKIPAILTTFQRIFAQAFQMSAVKEYEGEEGSAFFSSLFKVYNALMVILCAWLIYFLKPLAAFLFRKGFFEAWRLVPPLLISVIFGALEGFLGSICLAFKDGKSMGRATLTGAVVNIVLNAVLILRFGALGAAAATCASYFVMFVLAYRYATGHIALNVGFKRNLIAYALLIAEWLVLAKDLKGAYIWNACVAAGIMLLYAKEIPAVMERVRQRIKERRAE